MALVFLVTALSLFPAPAARAASIVVDTLDGAPSNDGECSLHEAINAASLNTQQDSCPAGELGVADTITFSVTGTITPTTALPSVNAGGSTIIDGGSGAPSVTISGSSVPTSTAFVLANGTHTIRGLAITDFQTGILTNTNTGNSRIESNHITDNGTGIILQSNNTTVGNADPALSVAAGNLISSNMFDGISIGEGATGNVVVGNRIGTTPAGTAADGNGKTGISIRGHENTIGGTHPNLANVISGNVEYGVFIIKPPNSGASAGSTNEVIGNLIGTDITGGNPVPNGHGGIALTGSDNMIGGATAGSGNIIAFNENPNSNTAPGVAPFIGTGNSILRNSIFENEGLGIDIEGDSVTANDGSDGNWDPDTGANNRQNFPVVVGATPSFGGPGTGDDSTTINAQLFSLPNTDFVVEFFANESCDESNHGEGEQWLGGAAALTDDQGVADVTETVDVGVPGGDFITATATVNNGGDLGDTSEFSQCFEVPSADLRVQKTGPSSVKVSKVATYTVTVTNEGPDSIAFPTVVDRVSATGKIVNYTTSGGESDLCTLVGRRVSCQFAAMGDDATSTLTVRVRSLAPGSLKNTASVSSETFDPIASNNKDAVTSTASCQIEGNGSNQTLNGTPKNDVICGFGGRDKIFGKGGKDFIVGGGGGDTIEGGNGGDELFGSAGGDKLFGGDGDDDMNGGGGTDVCKQQGGSGARVSCEKP